MPLTCFIPGCKTGYKTQRDANKQNSRKNPSVFKAPKDPAVFQQWQSAIPRTDKLLGPRNVVCSRHFKKGDIMYYTEPIKLFDGSVYLHMLEKSRLKKGAVPSIFPDTPGHPTYIPKIKSSKKKKYSKQIHQCVDTKQLKVQKSADYNYESEIAEMGSGCFSSKGKENVLKTDLSFLPSVILNCLTSEPHAVISTLNETNSNECQPLHSQSLAENNFSSESPTSSSCLENVTVKENVSFQQSKLNDDIVSKVPEKIASFIKYLSSNMEIISLPPNEESDVSDESEDIFKLSEVSKDISTTSQDIVQLSSDSQRNLTNSEVTHKHSNTRNSSLDFRGKFTQLKDPNESLIKSYVTLQPLDPGNLLTIDPDLIPQSLNNLNILAKKSNNSLQPKSITTATEVIQQYPDTHLIEPTVCHSESEMDVDKHLTVSKDQFCFDFLKANTDEIDKMNPWWTVNTFDDFVIYAQWNSDVLVDRKIIVYKDLNIKVFLKEKEVIIENSSKATSIENISKLILKVEGLQLCENFMDEERNCNGYLNESFICKKRNLCVNCIRWEYERLRNERKQKKPM